MRKFALAGVLLFAAIPAQADPAYVITNMSCSKVQAAVQAKGSVILRWTGKSGLPLYSRYVSDRRYCQPGYIVNFANVPAADKSCVVKKCVLKVPNRR
ncbi:hypothetical protein ABMA32_16025 [Mesorhizobium sp. VNQ89]|uniref:hypothetical protein n=1 Tax=Mesorhizobium quangtriensis TaxID=3157709 RepID=UPI0032B7F884